MSHCYALFFGHVVHFIYCYALFVRVIHFLHCYALWFVGFLKRPVVLFFLCQYCTPGSWLTDLSLGRYDVREKKCVKKVSKGCSRLVLSDFFACFCINICHILSLNFQNAPFFVNHIMKGPWMWFPSCICICSCVFHNLIMWIWFIVWLCLCMYACVRLWFII